MKNGMKIEQRTLAEEKWKEHYGEYPDPRDERWEHYRRQMEEYYYSWDD